MSISVSTGRVDIEPPSRAARRVRVLFLVEGFTDIRFVVGLSQICDLTMMVPSRAFREGGLAERVAESKATLRVIEIPGSRLRFQLQSMRELWRHVGRCDLILSQEVLRGSLNANIIGLLRRKPVVTNMGISPLEYFRCRRERRQIGPVTWWLGSTLIHTLVTINGRLATRCLALGPYLRDLASRWCARTEIGLYYGVDVEYFRPADAIERSRLRQRLDLPRDKFLIVLSSRISHEKDPETVLRAVALARSRGLDAVLLNLGGGHREFLALAARLGVDRDASWVLARAAVHPMKDLADYFRAADAVAMASLAEGAGISPLEALACGTPVVATAVGGMAQLRGYASLTPRRDARAMADALLAIAARPDAARAQARSGREYVCREWSRDKAFADLALVFESVANGHRRRPLASPMTDVQHSVDAGQYARQQLHSRDPLIAWSHRRRFRTALALARPFADGRLLDYGCGDGTFLSLLQTGAAPALAVGAEIDPRLVADCGHRFAAVPGVRFVDIADLRRADHAGAYDAVFCMEVLEHVTDPLPLLADFERLLAPGGTLVISVPIETGLPVLVKQFVRQLAGWRRIGDYPGTSSYTSRELVKSVFAGSRPHVARPVFPRSDGSLFHDHKGFNWRALRATVASRFDLVRTVTSPFNWPGPHFGTQVWFVARTRAAGVSR